MDFYYHPIFGLQLTFGCNYIAIDLTLLPKEFNSNKIMELLFQRGVYLKNSFPIGTITQIHTITSNA